jgi:hypothetical protein
MSFIGTRWYALALGMSLSLGVPAAPADPADPYYTSPAGLGQRYLQDDDWAALDALVDKLAASGERADDGRFWLYKVSRGAHEWFGALNEDSDDALQEKFIAWQEQRPDSAYAPVLAAMQVHSTAWRARGGGFSSSVTPEGWALFRERNAKAWKMIQAAKPKSSRLPTWYEEAISIGMDADVPSAQITALFNEGIDHFPGYHPLYFNYARQYSPRWGGDYAEADAFIKSQVVAKTNPEGEVLYARLYWLIDQYGGGDPDFFTESRVDWPRMRAGFELLMRQFPKSAWNQANFVMFACRAGDSGTYFKWRKTVDRNEFYNAAPEGISLEVCDARFTTRT